MRKTRFFSIFVLLGLVALQFSVLGPTKVSAASQCSCVVYIQNRFGIKNLGNNYVQYGKQMATELAMAGFQRIPVAQNGAVVVMSPKMVSPNNYRASDPGHVGVIVGLKDEGSNWHYSLRQGGSATSGATEYNCSNINTVQWAARPKSWDNIEATYWIPPSQIGAEVDTTKTYFLTNVNSGKVLDLFDGKTENGAWVTQWDNWNGPQQKLKFEKMDVKDGRNWYRIKFLASGKLLVVKDASMTPGAQVFQWDGESNNGLWTLISLGNNRYNLLNRRSGQLLAVADSSKQNNARVIQWYGLNIADQQWSLDIAK